MSKALTLPAIATERGIPSPIRAPLKDNAAAEFPSLISAIARKGYNVSRPSNTGHDKIVNGWKLEIKFSLSMTNHKKGVVDVDSFMMNHVSAGKDWEVLYFFGVNRDFSTVEILLTKESFKEIMNTPNQQYFQSQQGGKTLENDDWMCSGKNLMKLYNSDFNMKELKEC